MADEEHQHGKRQHGVQENHLNTIDWKRSKQDSIALTILDIQRELCEALNGYSGGKDVAFVYNPLLYAATPHEQYVHKFCRGEKSVLFLGMNPGPFGMAQTGVPFGEVAAVRDWMKISGKVLKPLREHPKRQIQGFECKRSEVSGARLWNFAKMHFGSPEAFFAKAFVYNYCPLVFMGKTGRNIVPGSLPIGERKVLFEKCDIALCKIVSLLGVNTIVGIGKFCYDRGRVVFKGQNDIAVVNMMHPSPASPAANKDWAGTVLKQLKESGVFDKLF